MSSAADLKGAKGRFFGHTADHRCRALLDLREGDQECVLRRELWLAYMEVAGHLGEGVATDTRHWSDVRPSDKPAEDSSKASQISYR